MSPSAGDFPALGEVGPTVNSSGTDGALAAAQDTTLRPLNAHTPTNLPVGKSPAAGQGMPEDPMAQEAGPDPLMGQLFHSFKRSVGGMRCCWSLQAVGEEPQDFSSSLLCEKTASQNRSIQLLNCFFSVCKQNISL